MSLTHDEIKKIAHLARIQLSHKEVDTYQEQFSNILNFMAQMNEVDTLTIAPLTHPLDISQRLREDNITEPDLRETYQALAPEAKAGFYLVSKVMEEA